MFGRKRDYHAEFYSYQVEELGHSTRTADSYLSSFRSMERLTGKPMHEVTVTDLRNLKRLSNYQTSTRAAWISAAHVFHSWGAMEGYWSLNGIMSVPPNRVIKNRRPALSLATARLCLESCRFPTEYQVVYYGLYAGCRIEESARMRESHWRGDNLEFIGKGSKERTVPIHEELMKVRDILLSHEPKSAGVLQSAWARMRERIGAYDLSGHIARSHSLRKTFANVVYGEGQRPWEVVKKILGHAEDTTNAYIVITEAQMREAVASADYWPDEPIQLAFFE